MLNFIKDILIIHIKIFSSFCGILKVSEHIHQVFIFPPKSYYLGTIFPGNNVLPFQILMHTHINFCGSFLININHTDFPVMKIGIVNTVV